MKLQEVCSGASVRELIIPTRPGYSAFNPSIAWSPERGYACVVRSANYRMDPLGRYLMGGTAIETKNFFCPMDSALNIVDMQSIDDAAVTGEIRYPYVLGMEDARLFWHLLRQEWRTYGTVRYRRPDGLCRVAEDRLDDAAVVVERRHFEAPFDDSAHEKNWAYLETLSAPFVHSWQNAPTWRGSSQIIRTTDRLGSEWEGITAVHTVEWHNGRRVYLTTLVKVAFGPSYRGRGVSTRDLRWHVIGVTAPFSIIRAGIEFVAGAALWGDQVALSFGFFDERAMLALVPLDQIQWKSPSIPIAPVFATLRSE